MNAANTPFKKDWIIYYGDQPLKIEVRNEGKRQIYVQLCKTPNGVYLHVTDKSTRHVNMLVKSGDYRIIESEEREQ